MLGQQLDVSILQHAPEPIVLIVEDESELADLYAAWIPAECTVRTAYTGEQALDAADEAVDVVLLDRRLPGMAGDKILTEFRDRGLTCPVAMVSAVDPDFDIVDLSIDEYVTKPASRNDIREIVEQLMRRSTVDEKIRTYFALASKKAVLDVETNTSERTTNDKYAQLEQELAEVRSTVDAKITTLDDADINAMIRNPSQIDRARDEAGTDTGEQEP